eukprot:Tbor_TRINITY_DN974_c0_g1::TRINITY_DN974_c0_g1_i1::g.21121::m.21121/K03259/EIF4E; translation initiation factor 4E
MTTNTNTESPCLLSPHHFPKLQQEQGHPLQHSWTLWYDGKKSNINTNNTTTVPPTDTAAASWAAQLIQIQTITTVEDFWSLFTFLKKPAAMEVRTNYYLFKTGYRPMWEDHGSGGRWVVPVQGHDLSRVDSIWEMALLAAIGGRLDGLANDNNENNNIIGNVREIKTVMMSQIPVETPLPEEGAGDTTNCMCDNDMLINNISNNKDILIGVALTKKPESFKVEFWVNNISSMDHCCRVGGSILQELGWPRTSMGKAPRIALLPLKVSNATQVLCQM